jgi:integrase
VANWLRERQVKDLRELDAQDVAGWRVNERTLVEQLVETSSTAGKSVADFRQADIWPGVFFGKADQVDWGGITIPWMRDITREWAWAKVNKYRDFGAIKKTATAVGVFARYLEEHGPEGGRNPSKLGKRHVESFAIYLTTLVAQKVPTGAGPANKAWSDKGRHFTLARNRLVIRWARDAGLLPTLPPDFNITDDLVPARPISTGGDDEIGKALPDEVLRQLLSESSLNAVKEVWREDSARFFLILAETGRRPNEICTLAADCVDESRRGGPFLIYKEWKVSGGEERLLPITSAVVRLVREQQKHVTHRFPQTALSDLCLFPRDLMNPHGQQPTTADNVSTYMRRWVNGLPSITAGGLDAMGNPTQFDRSLIFPYAFRHSYVQRRADAGVPPDVLKELMGHEQIQTTMVYYKVSRARQREATALVGSLLIDGEGSLSWGGMTVQERLRREIGTVVVPYGTCSEPSNVAAEGHACPMRWQCPGCGHFDSDPSYLPDLRRHLSDLLSQQALVDAFDAGATWAKARARPSDEEIAAIREQIRKEEAKLEAAPVELRDQIESASTELRKARAAQREIPVTIRSRPNGRDVLLGPEDPMRAAALEPTSILILDADAT